MVTVVEISNVETKAELQGDFSVDDVRDMFEYHYPVILDCVATETIDGDVKTITFRERTALKGKF